MLNNTNQDVYYVEYSGRYNTYRLEFYNAGLPFTAKNYIKLPNNLITKLGKLEFEYDKICKGLHSDITFDLEMDLQVLSDYGTTYSEFELLLKNQYKVPINYSRDISDDWIFADNSYYVSGTVCRVYINSHLIYIGVCEDNIQEISENLFKGIVKLEFVNAYKLALEKCKFKSEDGLDYARVHKYIDNICTAYDNNDIQLHFYNRVYKIHTYLAYALKDVDNNIEEFYKGYNDTTIYFMNFEFFWSIFITDYNAICAMYYRDTDYSSFISFPTDETGINSYYSNRYHYATKGYCDSVDYSSLYIIFSIHKDTEFDLGHYKIHTLASFILTIAEKYETFWDFIQDFFISENKKYYINRTGIRQAQSWESTATTDIKALSDIVAQTNLITENKLSCNDCRINEFTSSSEFCHQDEINNVKKSVSSRNKQDKTIPIIFSTGIIDLNNYHHIDGLNSVRQKYFVYNSNYIIDRYYHEIVINNEDNTLAQVNDGFESANTTIYNFLDNTADTIGGRDVQNFKKQDVLMVESQLRNSKYAVIAKKNLDYYSKAWQLELSIPIPNKLTSSFHGFRYTFDINEISKTNYNISKSKVWEILKAEIDLEKENMKLTLITSEYEG